MRLPYWLKPRFLLRQYKEYYSCRFVYFLIGMFFALVLIALHSAFAVPRSENARAPVQADQLSFSPSLNREQPATEILLHPLSEEAHHVYFSAERGSLSDGIVSGTGLTCAPSTVVTYTMPEGNFGNHTIAIKVLNEQREPLETYKISVTRESIDACTLALLSAVIHT